MLPLSIIVSSPATQPCDIIIVSIVEARLEFDPSWNHSCQEQALCCASECAKL